jgi:hypothetical protein
MRTPKHRAQPKNSLTTGARARFSWWLGCGLRPVAAQAEIKFLKIAKSNLTARATIDEGTDVLRQTLKKVGKVAFEVHFGVVDESGRGRLQLARLKEVELGA